MLRRTRGRRRRRRRLLRTFLLLLLLSLTRPKKVGRGGGRKFLTYDGGDDVLLPHPRVSIVRYLATPSKSDGYAIGKRKETRSRGADDNLLRRQSSPPICVYGTYGVPPIKTRGRAGEGCVSSHCLSPPPPSPKRNRLLLPLTIE